MDPEKVKAILEWEAPRSIKGICSFVSFANFYRQFIKNFSLIVSPLTCLTRKGTKFEWGSSQQTAFETLKKEFVSKPAQIGL